MDKFTSVSHSQTNTKHLIQHSHSKENFETGHVVYVADPFVSKLKIES